MSKTLEQLAREAGMDREGERWFSQSSDPLDSFDVLTADLDRFRAACRAEALEEAAKVCEARIDPACKEIRKYVQSKPRGQRKARARRAD